MAKWRTLDLIEFEGSLSYSKGQFHARYPDGSKKSTPSADVAALVIGPRASIHASVFSGLSRYGISLIACDWKHDPLASALPHSTHTVAGRRQRGQDEMTIPRRKQAWARLVRAKIDGQARVLDHHTSRGGDDLRVLARKVRSGDPGNVEALAARVYWPRLFGPEFSRDPTDHVQVNAALNYGYTIVRGTVLRGVYAAGLWPALGVHHHHLSNAHALADDLIEPFRPAVDDHVARIVSAAAAEEVLSPDARRTLAGSVSSVFDPETGRTLAACVTSLCQQYGQYAEHSGEFRPLPYAGP